MSARDAAQEAIATEQAVLGAVLLSGESFERIADALVADDFSTPGHRTLFGAIASLFDAGQPIDALTTWNALGRQRAGELDLSYLNDLVQNVPSAANVRRYADLVRRRAILRKVAEIGGELQTSASHPGADPHAIAAQAEARLMQALDRGTGDPVLLGEAVHEAMAYADERQRAADTMSGLPTGFASFDRFTNGLEPGQLVVVAARPSVGKTAFACCVASAMSASGNVGLFFTLEMTRREIGQRILSLRSSVPTHAMRSGTRDDEQWNRMGNAYVRIQSEKVYVDDTPAVTVGHLRAKGRRLKRKAGLDFVIVDYIGLMRGTGDNRTQELGSISRGLKELAKELSVPIIALAQLNRGVESRVDKRPILSDLRDSGEIEQDADIVAMLHRESRCGGGPEWDGFAELLIRKNRNGPTGDMLLGFDESTGRFSDTSAPNPRGLRGSQRGNSRMRGGFDE